MHRLASLSGQSQRSFERRADRRAFMRPDETRRGGPAPPANTNPRKAAPELGERRRRDQPGPVQLRGRAGFPRGGG